MTQAMVKLARNQIMFEAHPSPTFQLQTALLAIR